jgi:hypothetical protein
MMLAWPNRADAAGLDQGSWSPTLPVTNMLNRVLGIRARSQGTSLAATQFRVNLSLDKTIRVLALANHNFSVNARLRLRGGNSASFASSLYDSGWLPVFGGGGDSLDLEWEDDGFWTGGILAEDIEGYRATLVHILPADVRATYWLVEIDDQYNAAGYVEIGRLFLGPVWQPVFNLGYGATIEWVSRSNVAEAASGAEYFEERQAYRVVKGQLKTMQTDEAMGKAFEFQRRMDVTRDFVFIWSPADGAHLRRRAFLARLRQLSAIEHPYHNNYGMPIEIKEIL